LVEGTTMVRTIRRWRAVPLGLALAFLALPASCAGATEESGMCLKLCEQGQDECPLVPRVDCENQCLYEDARGETTGCESEVEAVTRCSAKLADICTTPAACDPQIDAFWACIGAYCAKHPSSQYCDDKPGSR
jgi:hypothetical protein